MENCLTKRAMRRRTKAGWAGLTACFLTIGALPVAQAALTENLAVSPTAMSLGNAVTADPPGIDAVHFNPAGLARLKGEQHSHSLTVVSVRTNASFNQPDDFNIGGWRDDPLDGAQTGPVRHKIYLPGIGMPGWRLPALLAPGMGLSYNKPDSPFTFATASYPTMAAPFDHSKDPNDPAQYSGKLVHLQRLVLAAPAVGFKVSDTLSIGAAVPIANAAMYLNTNMRTPNPLLGIVGKIQQGWCPENGGNILDTFTVGLCGGGPEGRINPFKNAANLQVRMTAPVDPTVNLGILWDPKPWLGLGLVYQSGSKTKYSGHYTFKVEPMLRKFVEGLNSSLLGPIVGAMMGMPQSIPEVQSGNMTSVIPFPQHIQLGVKLKPVEYLQFNVDANYTDWKTWDAMTFQFDQSIKLLEMVRLFGVADPTKLSIPRGYKSVLHFGYGMQVKASDKLTLRFGYEPRKSSIPLDKMDLVAPLPDTKLYGLGLNYKINKDSDISVAASYQTGKFNVPARTSCNMNCDGLFNVIYNPFAGLDVAGAFRLRYFGVTYTKRY